jgi:hypothetical protein
MTDPTPPAADPTPDPRDTELQELRADRERRAQQEQADKDAELEGLRKFKAEQEEKAAKAVKAPVRKADKPAETPTAAPALPQPAMRRRGKAGASRLWFGEDDE